MAKDLFAFLCVVFNYWAVLVTGGIITAIITAIETYKEKAFSWKYSKWIFLCFLFIAFFLAWRDEHRGKINAENKSKDIEKKLEEKRPWIFMEWLDSHQVLRIINYGNVPATKVQLRIDNVSDWTITLDPHTLPLVEVGPFFDKECHVIIGKIQQHSNPVLNHSSMSLLNFMKKSSLCDLIIFCTYSDMQDRTFDDTFHVIQNIHGLAIQHGNTASS